MGSLHLNIMRFLSKIELENEDTTSSMIHMVSSSTNTLFGIDYVVYK